jgi:hypothetical protein
MTARHHRTAATADPGRWRVCLRRETLEDLLAGDLDLALAGAVAPGGREEGQP